MLAELSGCKRALSSSAMMTVPKSGLVGGLNEAGQAAGSTRVKDMASTVRAGRLAGTSDFRRR